MAVETRPNPAPRDHGALAGLGDDDHSQYLLVNGTRSMTGDLNLNTNQINNVVDPTSPQDVTTKAYVDSKIQGLEWQDSVLDKDETDPSGLSPSVGDRYVVGIGAIGVWAGHDNEIAEWNGSTWDFTVPQEGYALWVEDEDRLYVFNGTNWVVFGSTLDHGVLQGLSDDDHTQYLLADCTRDLGGILKPDGDGTRDLGTTSAKFKDFYMNGDIISANPVNVKASGDADQYIQFITSSNIARIRSVGSALYINDDAANDVHFFADAASGENRVIYITGYNEDVSAQETIEFALYTEGSNSGMGFRIGLDATSGLVICQRGDTPDCYYSEPTLAIYDKNLSHRLEFSVGHILGADKPSIYSSGEMNIFAAGQLNLMGNNNSKYIQIETVSNITRMRSIGSALYINDDAVNDVQFFSDAGIGENPSVIIGGYDLDSAATGYCGVTKGSGSGAGTISYMKLFDDNNLFAFLPQGQSPDGDAAALTHPTVRIYDDVGGEYLDIGYDDNQGGMSLLPNSNYFTIAGKHDTQDLQIEFVSDKINWDNYLTFIIKNDGSYTSIEGAVGPLRLGGESTLGYETRIGGSNYYWMFKNVDASIWQLSTVNAQGVSHAYDSTYLEVAPTHVVFNVHASLDYYMAGITMDFSGIPNVNAAGGNSDLYCLRLKDNDDADLRSSIHIWLDDDIGTFVSNIGSFRFRDINDYDLTTYLDFVIANNATEVYINSPQEIRFRPHAESTDYFALNCNANDVLLKFIDSAKTFFIGSESTNWGGYVIGTSDGYIGIGGLGDTADFSIDFVSDIINGDNAISFLIKNDNSYAQISNWNGYLWIKSWTDLWLDAAQNAIRIITKDTGVDCFWEFKQGTNLSQFKLSQHEGITHAADEAFIDISPTFTITEPGLGDRSLFGMKIDLSAMNVNAAGGNSDLYCLYLRRNTDGDARQKGHICFVDATAYLFSSSGIFRFKDVDDYDNTNYFEIQSAADDTKNVLYSISDIQIHADGLTSGYWQFLTNNSFVPQFGIDTIAAFTVVDATSYSLLNISPSVTITEPGVGENAVFYAALLNTNSIQVNPGIGDLDIATLCLGRCLDADARKLADLYFFDTNYALITNYAGKFRFRDWDDFDDTCYLEIVTVEDATYVGLTESGNTSQEEIGAIYLCSIANKVKIQGGNFGVLGCSNVTGQPYSGSHNAVATQGYATLDTNTEYVYITCMLEELAIDDSTAGNYIVYLDIAHLDGVSNDDKIRYTILDTDGSTVLEANSVVINAVSQGSWTQICTIGDHIIKGQNFIIRIEFTDNAETGNPVQQFDVYRIRNRYKVGIENNVA